MEPVRVDLLDNGGIQVWGSFEDVDAWVTREEAFWGWILRVDHSLNILRDLANDYANRFRELRAFGDNPPDPAAALDLCRNHCESQFAERIEIRWNPPRGRKLPTSNSSFGKYIPSLIQRPFKGDGDKPSEKEAMDRFALAGAVIHLHRNGSFSMGADWTRLTTTAHTAYGLWLAGITVPQIDISRVDSLCDSLTASMDTATASASRQLTETKNTLSTCSDALSRHRESFDRTLDDHRKQLAGIEDAYRKQMALRKPAEYWSERNAEHKDGAQNWLAATVISAVTIISVLLWMASWLWPDTKELIGDLKSAGAVENAAAIVGQLVFASAAKFAVVAGITVWWLRICVRNYLSHVHLSRDASERVSVIKSLIAMSTDEELRHLEGIKKEGLTIALQNVFRHASDGVVKDDGLPATNVLQMFKGND